MDAHHLELPHISRGVLLTDLFKLVLAWRILYGSFKVVLGLSLLKFHGMRFTEVFAMLTRHELSQDPHDVLVNFIHTWLTHSPHQITYFLASYFLFWGIIDIILSVLLLQHKLWAFPLSSALIVLFVIYEIFRFTHTHSLILLGVIVVDIILLGLIVREERLLKAKLAKHLAAISKKPA